MSVKKIKSIFTVCGKCDRVRLISTPCDCKSYDNNMTLEQEIIHTVEENQPISAMSVTHIINKRSRPRIATTYGQTNWYLRNNKLICTIKSMNGYDSFMLASSPK